MRWYQFCLTWPGAPVSWFPAVVDVYQGWCGPCKPVVSLFQKMRVEVGPDLLHFASVRSLSVEQRLQKNLNIEKQEQEA